MEPPKCPNVFKLHGSCDHDRLRRSINMKHKFEIYKHIGDISQSDNGWTKEDERI